MLDDASFLVFAPNPWHGLWRNRQQIFSRLARSYRVLYVEPGRSSLRDLRQLRYLRRPAVAQERPSLWIYRAPTWLPVRGAGGPIDRLSNNLLAAHLRRTLGQLGFYGSSRPREKGRKSSPRTNAPILWLYRPTNWHWATSSFPHRLLVYHVTDDYTAFSHLTTGQREALAAAEQELLAAANLTVVTSPRLLEIKSPLARRIALVPNAVDYETFRQAATHAQSQAQASIGTLGDLHLPRPILGYSGHISSRLDLTLLRDLALARPEWQLVFAGSQWAAGCAEELAALKQLPNVHFLGQLPVDRVPQFVAACDICLIPYQVTDETRAVSSLKLYEYLAAGKPVVSAAVPAAQEHSAVIFLADPTVQSWQDRVEAALAQATDQESAANAIATRQAVAAANTWEDRVDQIEELLVQVLQG